MKPERKAKNIKAKREKISKKQGNSKLIIGVVAVILLAGVAYAVLSSDSGSTKKSPVSEIKLPSYAYTNPLTLKAYRYATEHPDILEQIPCYCGCGGHSGHRFLRDCYIHDDWTYDDHASFCDVCIGEAIKTQDYLASGMTLKEARAKIDAEYSLKGGGTDTPPVSDYYTPVLSPRVAGIPTATAVESSPVDLSALYLSDNFKSLSDGLKLIPPDVSWAYFANLKQGIDPNFIQKYIPGIDFYRTQIVAILNSEYKDGSWVELHDVGKNDAIVQVNSQQNADNIVSKRPYIFSTKDKTNSVLAIFNDSANNANAYSSLISLLEKVDDENAGFAKINTDAPPFADLSYFGLVKSENDVKGEIAFRIKDNGALPMTKYNELKDSAASRGFKSYEVRKENDILIIEMTSDLDDILSEATQNYGIRI